MILQSTLIRIFFCSPIKSQLVVPIIQAAVANNPDIMYHSIREMTKPYAKDYALTNIILQEARDIAKLQLFGPEDDNI